MEIENQTRDSKRKAIIKWLPEIYFLVGAIWCAIETLVCSKDPNYLAILLIIVITIQLFIKNRIIGLAVSSAFGLAFLYLTLAFFSDLIKATSFNFNTVKFITGGTLVIGSTLIMAFRMFRKYYKADQHQQKN